MDDLDIVRTLSIGKTPHFPGSRAEKKFEKQEDFYENRTYKKAKGHRGVL